MVCSAKIIEKNSPTLKIIAAKNPENWIKSSKRAKKLKNEKKFEEKNIEREEIYEKLEKHGRAKINEKT